MILSATHSWRRRDLTRRTAGPFAGFIIKLHWHTPHDRAGPAAGRRHLAAQQNPGLARRLQLHFRRCEIVELDKRSRRQRTSPHNAASPPVSRGGTVLVLIRLAPAEQ